MVVVVDGPGGKAGRLRRQNGGPGGHVGCWQGGENGGPEGQAVSSEKMADRAEKPIRTGQAEG